MRMIHPFGCPATSLHNFKSFCIEQTLESKKCETATLRMAESTRISRSVEQLILINVAFAITVQLFNCI